MEAVEQKNFTIVSKNSQDFSNIAWTPERLAKLHWIIDTESPEAEELRKKIKAILTE
ncbi:hypothetical protein [Brevibacillus sp. HD3.3A]|uniref:hypothetical protein n=1 Tax=Brevibacillus sp. HD3.3A TaxID=2738979 RepID=UPI00156BBDF7|nr:hypothetical protein [Brevibacillus sp. HD3.3A]UED72106.1 hypothetical protein HP435_28790 [Brevibacillus sp. HD3.3A]